jgi:hypothetical protein
MASSSPRANNTLSEQAYEDMLLQALSLPPDPATSSPSRNPGSMMVDGSPPLALKRKARAGDADFTGDADFNGDADRNKRRRIVGVA